MVKAVVTGAIPLFLGNAGMGVNCGQLQPQIKSLDVFYVLPLVVGFHAQEDGSEVPIIGFQATYELPPEAMVVGLTAEESVEEPSILGFQVQGDGT